MQATAGRLRAVALEVVDQKGKVVVSTHVGPVPAGLQVGPVPAGLQPSSALTVITEPPGADTTTIQWTRVDAPVAPAETPTAAASEFDVRNVLAHMAYVVAHAIDILSLRAAIANRDDLATAKGMLMERNHIDAQTAFTLLARFSQNTNTKAAVIARRVINTQ